MTDMIRAPWTPEQVEALNRFQSHGNMHPFTCGVDRHGEAKVLIATEYGWRCPDEECDYRQDWAPAFMADPAAWPKPFKGRAYLGPAPDAPAQLAALRDWSAAEARKLRRNAGLSRVPEVAQALAGMATAHELTALVIDRMLAGHPLPVTGGPDEPAVRDGEMAQLRAELAAERRRNLVANSRAVRDEARAQVAAVREYVATSDDDGIRTRQHVLDLVGELPDEALNALAPEAGR